MVTRGGIFRVGLMNLKRGSPEDTRKTRLFIALSIAFGIGAVSIIMLLCSENRWLSHHELAPSADERSLEALRPSHTLTGD